MDSFRIQGGRRLAGRIQVEGSKNASLPLMAAALCTDGELTLRNVPCLSDISNMARLLRELGVQVDGDCGVVKMRVMDHNKVHAHYDIVKTMRASICVLGPLLARRRRAVIAMPGGCAFGSRPIDLHIRGMQALGAKVEYSGGDIIVRLPMGCAARPSSSAARTARPCSGRPMSCAPRRSPRAAP